MAQNGLNKLKNKLKDLKHEFEALQDKKYAREALKYYEKEEEDYGFFDLFGR